MFPRCICMKQKTNLQIDEQGDEKGWFDLQEVADNSGFHKYKQNYVSWLIKAGVDND